MNPFQADPPYSGKSHASQPGPLNPSEGPRPPGRKPSFVNRVLALSLLAATGVGLLHYIPASPGSATPAPVAHRYLAAGASKKPFFWRKDLTHLIMHKDLAQVRTLLGPPDGIYRHGDGRQIWFYHRLSADRHTQKVDGLTALKISPDGHINHIAFRRTG